MKICLQLIVGLLSLSQILGQVHEDQTERRYSRAVATMDELLKLEEELALNLEGYIVELMNKYNTISRGIHMMRQRHQFELEQGSKEFWENPLNSYSLIRHMQSDWHMWQVYMEKPEGLEQLTYLKSKKEAMPVEHDFQDAAEGLRRVQWTYNLSATDISQGLLDGVQYNSSLTALDCWAMAQHLINASRWENAGKWLLAGVKALERPDPQPAIQVLTGPAHALIYKAQAQIRIQQGKMKDALKAYEAALFHSPQDAELWRESRVVERSFLTLPGTHTITEEPEELDENTRTPNCCSGRCAVPLVLQLYCLWNTNSHPFLRLAAIKTEILSLDPYVILLHDVVSEVERDFIRLISKEHLLPSFTVNVDTNVVETAKYRTSKSVWYRRSSSRVTERLTMLLQDATGLDMDRSESFQVINYGVGGLFETHLDSLLDDADRFQGKPDRLATTIFYLSDVPQGGATFFPYLNLTIFPQAGSALFWYNLDKIGNEHIQTHHAGCPVIVGSKWVMSKWIEDQGQELRKPCII